MPSSSPSFEEFCALEREVKGLKQEVSGLVDLVGTLKDELRELKAIVDSQEFPPESVSSKGNTFSLISELRLADAEEQRDLERQAAARPSGAPLLESDREAAVKSIGLFLGRAARGEPRGPSGRERIDLASRYWVVVKSFEGEEFSPVKVFNRWSSAKDLVKKGQDLGASVFVGLPALQDVRLALTTGGFAWDGLVEG